MNKNNKNHALHITKNAKHGKYVDCDIQGVKDEGYGTQMIRTKIYNFRKEHLGLWKTGMVSLFFMLIAGIILLGIQYGYFVE